MAIIGDTGTGKSTLAAHLLAARKAFVVLRSKPDTVKYPGAKRIRRASAMADARVMRFELNPYYEQQYRQFAEAINTVWREGHWALYADELYYLTRKGLGEPIEILLTQGRSKKITTIVGMQRPVSVSRFAISQATHILAFRQEPRDAKTLAEASIDSIRDVVVQLPRYHFVWYYRPERLLWVGTFDRERGQLAPA